MAASEVQVQRFSVALDAAAFPLASPLFPIFHNAQLGACSTPGHFTRVGPEERKL